jgi:hypothetical protein
MPSITLLTEIAEAAGAEADGDWFDPDLIDSDVPISSSRLARAHIAAFNPATMALILDVVKAAKGFSTIDDQTLNMFAFADLCAALAALEAAP